MNSGDSSGVWYRKPSFKRGLDAHECILDLRAFKGTTAEDVAKRLMDYLRTLSRAIISTGRGPCAVSQFTS